MQVRREKENGEGTNEMGQEKERKEWGRERREKIIGDEREGKS